MVLGAGEWSISGKDFNMADFVNIDPEEDALAYRYDTQLLMDRRDEDLDEDAITDYITEHFEGNSLIVAGDEDLIKIHFHTNYPWKVLEYCNTVGEIYDIVIEDMIRQSSGLQFLKETFVLFEKNIGERFFFSQ